MLSCLMGNTVGILSRKVGGQVALGLEAELTKPDALDDEEDNDD